MFDLLQVVKLGCTMSLCKREHFLITTPLRNSHDALVNAHSSRLTGMIGAQFSLKVKGKGWSHEEQRSFMGQMKMLIRV